jgi:hypothetical protein
MHDFHYKILKPKCGANIHLLMTDIDSFVYEIKTEDFYEDIKGMQERYNMSKYSK